MTKRRDALPPNVLQALETLEAATTAGDLGQAYQTVLDWRRKSPSHANWRGVLDALLAFALWGAAVYVIPRVIDSESEYWQGFMTGAWLILGIVLVRDIFAKRTNPTPSLSERVDIVIDRWRHLTPLMRDIPK